MKNIQNLQLRVGPPVTGSNFFGREKELDFIWNNIQAGNNYKFPSPRRVGKTSFGLELLRRAEAAGWDTVSINLEESHNERDFLLQFTDALTDLSWWEKQRERGGNFFEYLSRFRKIKIGGLVDIDLAGDFQKQKENLYRELSAKIDHTQPTLILVDEVTVLLNAIQAEQETGLPAVTAFLHWLRALRQVKNSQIRWIFISSIGIENFTQRLRLSKTVNDFTTYELKPFSKLTTLQMIEGLERGEQFPLNVTLRELMVEKIGYLLPYFVQLLFGKMKELHQLEAVPLDPNLVHTAYQRVAESSSLNTWIERLREQYGEQTELAFAVLKLLCAKPAGLSRSDLLHQLPDNGQTETVLETNLAEVIALLTNDGYLFRMEQKYVFRSPLIRHFWYNRFIL